MPDETKESAVAFLEVAIACCANLGITLECIMTDDGFCYRSEAFAEVCRELGIRHVRTRPGTLNANGKAECFIQTALREWTCARAYANFDRRAGALPEP